MAYKGFSDVVGHRDIVAHLQNAIDNAKVSHAYLFAGEPGSGKKMMAEIFAKTLECKEGEDNPCLVCESCRKVDSHNHPDIIYVTHEKPNVISVDEIRGQVVNTVDILPYESKYKVYIIDDAEKMNVQAQNAILKTIEEPPEYAVIILLADSREALLPTILSRCVTLSFKAVKDAYVEEYLIRKMQIPDYEAQVVTAFAQGNIGRARQTVSDERFSEILENATALVKEIPRLEVYEIASRIRSLKDEKNDIDEYLDIFLVWYRDVLLYKATKDIEGLVFRREVSEIMKEASCSSYEGIEQILSAVDKVKVRLRANVNFELAMELFFLTVKENIEIPR